MAQTATSCSAWASTAPSSSTTPPTSTSSSSTISRASACAPAPRCSASSCASPAISCACSTSAPATATCSARICACAPIPAPRRSRSRPTPRSTTTRASARTGSARPSSRRGPSPATSPPARPCSQSLAPYIWRKYLDFAAIADIHAMKRQIHAYRGFGTIGVAGHNIKVGRGGIREIEFFVQTQQLIAGGRQSELRVSDTLTALQRLEERRWITAAARDELGRGLPLPAHRRASPADGRRRADPDAARGARQAAGARPLLRLSRYRRLLGSASPGSWSAFRPTTFACSSTAPS